VPIRKDDGAADQPQPDQPVSDPFKLDRLRMAPLDDIATEHVMLAVPVRRPGRQEWFRVHRDPSYVIDCLLLERKDGEGMVRERYWVDVDLYNLLLEEATRIRLFTCISTQGTVFLWPCKLPTGDNAGKRWAETRLVVAEAAKESWARLVGNQQAAGYDFKRPESDLGEPKWPSKTFEDLIRLAFDGKMIDSPDHPAVRELRGRE